MLYSVINWIEFDDHCFDIHKLIGRVTVKFVKMSKDACDSNQITIVSMKLLDILSLEIQSV